MTEQIEFRKERDFGDVINVTFAFLRQNFVLLGKSLLLFVGPVSLIGGLSSAGMWNQITAESIDEVVTADELWLGLFGLSYFLFIILSMFSTLLAVIVVNGYMILYRDRGAGNFYLEDVWDMVKEHFWKMLGTAFFALFLYVGSIFVLVIPITFVALTGALTSPLFAGLLSFVLIIAWLMGFFYFIVVLSLLFPIRMYEPIGNIDAFKRSRYLIRSNFGSSFAVLFVSTLLMTVLGLLFNAPSYMFIFFGDFHAVSGSEASWWKYPMTVASVLGALGGSLLYAIPAASVAMQYFNLVEKKEKAGLMSRIEGLDDNKADELP